MSNEQTLAVIESLRQEFIKIKNLAEDAFYSLRNHSFYTEPFNNSRSYDAKPYSIGIIMQRTIGNLQSRWTDFLIADGEKASRNPEREFVSQRLTEEELITKWHDAWMVLFKAIVEELEQKPENLFKIIHINKQPFTVHEALLRQVTHHTFYASQIVILVKAMKRENNYDELLTMMDRAEEPR
jgi:hypothetical protein